MLSRKLVGNRAPDPHNTLLIDKSPLVENFMHSIAPIAHSMTDAVMAVIDNKTKPLGSLGQLEALAKQIALVQGSLTPALSHPSMLVFAADHGVTAQGVSPFPQEVTVQMVLNFLAGGAAINVFCRQQAFSLKVVNAGVKAPLDNHPHLVNQPIALGTADFTQAPAMTPEQCQAALALGGQCVDELHAQGCNVVGFGEMGIGNTTSASAIMAALLNVDPALCVGRGTGIDDAGITRKQQAIAKALALHALEASDPLRALQCVGGLEIAGIVGGMLRAAEQGMLVMVDGFIASAAALVAARIAPLCRDYMVFCHGSAEQGHTRMLEALDAEPLLNLGMRLGEGSGVAVAYPLLRSAVAFFNEMASFESAGVSGADAS
jgi:nicotinate-nucleotide--dimethylbenzimidazole phosphoribosyltransferase